MVLTITTLPQSPFILYTIPPTYFATNKSLLMNHLKPSPLFPHENALVPLSIFFPSPLRKKKKKTQVISLGVNPQRPNTVIRPPCYFCRTLLALLFCCSVLKLLSLTWSFVRLLSFSSCYLRSYHILSFSIIHHSVDQSSLLFLVLFDLGLIWFSHWLSSVTNQEYFFLSYSESIEYLSSWVDVVPAWTLYILTCLIFLPSLDREPII